MKKSTFTKLVATLLITATIGAAAGCSKKGENGKDPVYVAEDSLWYNATRVELEEVTYDRPTDYLYSEIIGGNEEYIVARVDGSYKMDYSSFTDEDWENIDYSDYSICDIIKYGTDGQIISQIDLNSEVKAVIEAEGMDVTWYVNNTFYGEGKVYSILGMYDNETYEDIGNALVVIDVDTEEISVDLDLELGIPQTQSMDEFYSLERVMPLPDGRLLTTVWCSAGETYSYLLTIINQDGTTETLDLRDEFPNLSIFDISSSFPSDTDGVIYLTASIADESGMRYLELDYNNLTITEAADDVIDLELANELYNYESLSNGLFGVEVSGVYEADLSTGEKTSVLSFADTNIDLSEVQNMRPLLVTEERIMVSGIIYNYQTKNNGETSGFIYTFEKADSNPNAGKEIITIGCVGEYNLSASVAHAAYLFNNTNEDAFIKFSFYTEDDYYDYDALNEAGDDYSEVTNIIAAGEAEMANAVAMDMISGDGPDIILNAFDIVSLQNDEYLFDMRDFISANFTDDDLFFSVIDAASQGDKLYNIPLNFAITGIVTNESRVDLASGVGFTFEEYEAFVEDECNGTNPIAMYTNRIDVFDQLLRINGDMFFDAESGTVAFETEEFYELCEYVLENIPEEYNYEDMDSGFFYTETVAASGSATEASLLSNAYWDDNNGYGTAWRSNIYDFSSYVNEIIRAGEDLRMYGYPSADGRGPSAEILNSIAISANANTDLCCEFVKTVISYDGMSADNTGWLNINVQVTNERVQDVVDIENENYNDMLEEGWTEQELENMGFRLIGETAIDDFRTVIDSISSIVSLDPSIMQIVNEEIGAYFSGQKDIEQVAATISDRAQTVLDER